MRQMRSIIKCATPLSNYLHPTPNISTNMDPIQVTIEAIESRDPGEDLSYNQVAKEFSIVRLTLIRRHKGQTQPYAILHAILYPQQEIELIQYIQRLTKRPTPPTQAIKRNFATSVARRSVSKS